MKRYAFQFACNSRWIGIIEDTDLITKREALALWEKYIPLFKKYLVDGDGPEMAIWRGMRCLGDYRETLKHIHHENTIVKDGLLYQLTSID